MGTIQEKLNLTLNNKNSIKSAIRSKGIEVTDEEPFSNYAQKIIDYKGIDTSDATATTGDIANGKTAYVNGEKIMGEVKFLANSEEEAEGMRIGNQGKVNLFESEDTTVVNIIEQTPERVAFEKDSFIATGVSYDKMSTAIGLTPDKLKFGEKVLNINGEFTSDATATAEDIAKDKTAYVNGEKVTGVTEIAKVSEYFRNTIGAGTGGTNIKNGLNKTMKKLPDNFFSISTIHCSYMFAESYIEVAPMMDTSNIARMSYMFYKCGQLISVPKYNTKSLQYMEYMFAYCTSLTNVPEFNTGAVSNMSNTFYNCSQLTTIPQLDTRNVTDMSYIFGSCSQLTEIPQLDTSKVTNMSSMFGSCSQLTTIPQLDTSSVTNMSSMFSGCSQLTEIPQLDANKVNSIDNMFDNCTALTNIAGLIDLGKGFSQRTTNFYKYKLNISYSSNLTYDCLINLINNLYDLNLNTNLSVDGVCQYTQTLSIGSTNIAKLTEEELAICNSKGWTVS